MPDKETMSTVLHAYGISPNAVASVTDAAGGSGGGFNFVGIFIGMLFGIWGMYAFNQGRKDKNYRYIVLGILLMVYPYFIMNNSWLIFIVGAVLTAALFLWKE